MFLFFQHILNFPEHNENQFPTQCFIYIFRKEKQKIFLKTNLEIPIFLVRKYSNDFYPRLERCLHLCLKVLASPPLKKKKVKRGFLAYTQWKSQQGTWLRHCLSKAGPKYYIIAGH